MKFLTWEEAKLRAGGTLTVEGLPQVQLSNSIVQRAVFESIPGYTYYSKAQEIVASLGAYEWCLLWVVLTEVWPSNENLHLYYRFRQSYSNFDQIHDRPGLVALRHEEYDLISFVHLGMLFGWEMYLVTSHDYGRVFISHDGYYEFSVVTPYETPSHSDETK